ncbi:uncharacterized protein BDW70DRAFT_154739 [Aspergillus foveolatus]|uniref:uncharacterized protein n=1 Tax=Aspergillus foveolatus TaxID=210207 RepID=UPI003CCCA1FD
MARAGVTPVFHPWKLRLAPETAYLGQIETPEPPYQIFDPEETEAHDEWGIDRIVDCREIRGNIQYKALYYGPLHDWNSNPPWQHWTDFKNAPEKILEYHKKKPNKPPAPEFFVPRA